MPGQVPGGGDLAVEVPDRLVGVRVVVGEEPAGVGLGEDAGVAPALAGGRPGLLRHRAQVEDVDHQQVAGLGALDLDGAAEHVGVGQVDVADVVGGVVVAELGVGPLAALDPELAARPYRGGRRDVGMPAVVAGDGLVAHGSGLVDAEDDVWHVRSLPFSCGLTSGAVGRCGAGRRGPAADPVAAGSWRSPPGGRRWPPAVRGRRRAPPGRGGPAGPRTGAGCRCRRSGRTRRKRRSPWDDEG